MQSLADQKDAIDTLLYTQMLEEMCKLLFSLGKALTIAFDGKSFLLSQLVYRCQGKVTANC